MVSKKKWFRAFPHPLVMLFSIAAIVAVLTHLLPAGSYERELIEGRERVIPGSFHYVDASPVGVFGLFRSYSIGFAGAAEIIFIVFASAIMFGLLEKAGVIENTVGWIIKKLGVERRFWVVVVMTFLFGLLGIVIGYENNIALVPIACIVALALGGDLMLGAGISVGAITIGFGLSPINPYTVGVGHKIAEMPLFSGAELRSLLVFIGLSSLAWYNVRYFRRILQDQSKSLSHGLDSSGLALSRPVEAYSISRQDLLLLAVFVGGLSILLYGIFYYHWYFTELSAIFIMIGLAAGIVARMNSREISETIYASLRGIAPGALVVGFAYAIKVVMDQGNIGDTITHHLSQSLVGFPGYLSAILMTLVQSLINLLIPSGSGQALVTLPIMIPLGEMLGITRQTAILAFQIGDGLTNTINPALGGLLAMLSLCRVPFDRWVRYIFPLTALLMVVCWLAVLFGVFTQWGPV